MGKRTFIEDIENIDSFVDQGMVARLTEKQ
jgi:hypothetical protein